MLRLSGLVPKGFKEIIQASGLLFLASGFANFCNLLFVLYMVRKLSTVQYGELNALFSLFMILSLPAVTIQTVVAETVAKLMSKREFAQIKCFLFYFGKRVIFFSSLGLAFYFCATPAIADFLKIAARSLIAITGSILFFAMVSPLIMGVLQGGQRFLALAVNMSFSALAKLALGLGLVVLGFGVMGALSAVGLAIFMGLVLAGFQLPKEVTAAHAGCSENLNVHSIYKYAIPVFLSMLGWMVLISGDVILVKHFFSPEEAGFYSVAQMAGKMILFLPSVVSIILFPKISAAYSQKQETVSLLKKGLLIVVLFCGSLGIFCSLFPGPVLKILARKETIESVRLVPFFCLAMTLYSLVYQFVIYNLAIHKFRFTIYLLVAGLLQLGLIWIFHPSLSVVLFFLIGSSLGLFLLGSWEAFRPKEES